MTISWAEKLFFLLELAHVVKTS